MKINEYQTQTELNPKLWKDGEFNNKLRLQLLKIARAFYKFLGIDIEIQDVTLTGSNANYNWTKHSDIDLHLIINYKDINDNSLLVRELMQAKKNLWNNRYPIKYKGMNIELYAQDSNEPHASTGVYSLFNNDWIEKPDADVVSVDDDAIDTKSKPYEYAIDHLDPYDKNLLDKIQNLKSRLKKLRQTGLETVGEYSIENLAFKSLRNSGHLEKLNDLEKDITLIQLTPTLEITENSNIFSADDNQSWPSGPFGKKDDYADESGDSYKRAKDWQIDKPSDDESTKGTGYIKEKKEKSNVDMILPRGKQKILKAEDKDYDRGLLVKLLDDGGYEMAYWYDKPNKPYPVEIIVDGRSVKLDGKIVEMKFHPKDYYDKQDKDKK